MNLNTPVAFIVYNRPEVTQTTFERIRSQRPRRLFLIADGPNPERPDDDVRCRTVRKVIQDVDWPCEVHRNFAEVNLGLKARVVSGMDWVFSHVDRTIVLEDDCLAHLDFFAFCEQLLERYENEPQVGAITGDNFQRGHRIGNASYYFSKYFHCWGWAAWGRTWDRYDSEMGFWSTWKNSEAWQRACPDPVERSYWEKIFDRTARGEIDTWAYQMTASFWYHGMLTATPNQNLVTNIGFGDDATHTKTSTDHRVATIPLGRLTHPNEVVQEANADRRVFDHHYGGNTLRARKTPVGYLSWLVRGSLRRASRILGRLAARSRT